MSTLKAEELAKYSGTNAKTAGELVILLHGHSDAGKTFCAATASEFFPEKLGTPAKLEDMLWIGADPGATAGLRRYGIDIPQVNFLDMMKDMGIIKAIDMTIKVAETLQEKNPRLKYVVPDTITALAKYVIAYYEEIMEGPQMHGRINSTLTRFHTGLMGTGLTPIFTAHSKSTDPTLKETDGQKKTKAALGTEDNPIVPMIPGQAFLTYTGSARLIGVVDRLTAGRGEPDKYKLYFSKPGWFTKNSFRDGVVPDTLDANLGVAIRLARAAMNL